MKAKIYCFVLFALLLATTLLPQSAQPGADAVYTQIEKTYTWHPDGSSRFDYHYTILLNTHQAANRFGESFIVFDPRWQSLTIDRSVTTMANGKEVPTPANGFIDVLPASVGDAPDYGFLVERVVSHTALEIGSRIDFAWHIESKAGFMPWLWGEELFAAPYPIAKMAVHVKLPAGIKLHFSTANGALDAKRTQEDGYEIFTWKTDQQAANLAESSQPAPGEFAPRLLFSTCPGWDALNGYVQGLLKAAESNNEKLSLSNAGKTAVSNPLESALELQRSIAEEMNAIHMEQEQVGYRLAPLERLASRNYATEWEKAALLVSRLRGSGLDAQFALLSSYRNFDRDTALLPVFNQAMAAVTLPGGEFHLLPVSDMPAAPVTAERQGYYAWRIDEVATVPEQIISAGENRVEYRAELSLDDTGALEGKIEIVLGGTQLPWYQLQKAGGAQSVAQKYLGKLLDDCEVTSTVIKSLDLQGAVIKVSMKMDKAVTPAAGGALQLLSPLKSNLDDWRLPVYQEIRSTPMVLPSAISEYIDLSIRTSSGVHWQYDPGFNFALNLASGSFLSSVIQADGKLSLQRQIVLHNNCVSPAEYEQVKQLVIALRINQAQKIAMIK